MTALARLPAVAPRWRGPLAVLGVLAVVVALPFTPPLAPEFRATQLQIVAGLSIIVIGLNLLTGFSGQLSLGHSGFALAGGYTAAILVDRGLLGLELSPWLAVPLAPLVAGGAGFLVGLPALRLSGPYLAIVTVGVALVTPVLLKWDPLSEVTGGVQGLLLPRPPVPAALDGALTPGRWRYLLVALPAVAAGLVAWNLTRSRFGRALVAIRDNELVAAQLGIDVARHKTGVFAISAAYAGLGGALLTTVSVGIVTPESFTLFDSLNYVVAIVIGGVASIWGSVLGAAVIAYEGDIVAFLLGDHWTLSLAGRRLLQVPSPLAAIERPATLGPAVFGVVLLVTLRLAPRGLAGLATTLVGRVRRWRAAGVEEGR